MHCAAAVCHRSDRVLDPSMTDLAFIGTGTMGHPMARNLLGANFKVHAFNRSAARARSLSDDGAELFEDPRAAADGCSLLLTMLSDADAVLETAAPALEALQGERIWIQMSTIGIDGIERCVELAEQAGVSLVDAPALGTREPAQKGALVVLASGPNDARGSCQPVFDAVGSRTLWLGEAGGGNRAGVGVNSWIVGVVAVLAETITLAQALDIDPRQFFEAVKGGPLDLAYAQIKGGQMIDRSFDDPAFRLALSRKDADLVLAAAAQAGLEVPVMQAVAERLALAEQAGHGDEDMAATYWATAPTD